MADPMAGKAVDGESGMDTLAKFRTYRGGTFLLFKLVAQSVLASSLLLIIKL